MRKKVDKESIEYISKHLFHADKIIGFQFTVGNTPLGVIEKRPYEIHCSLNKSGGGNVVIDCSEGYLAERISVEVFGKKDKEITKEQLKSMQKQFKKLNYEVESGEFAGEWHWFRIACNNTEILNHVEILKNNIKI